MPAVYRNDRLDLGSDALPADVRALLASPARTVEGFLLIEGIAARSGIQLYQRADGALAREYRPPEEVLHADSLATYAGRPITQEHPVERGALTGLDPTNATTHTRGSIVAVEPIEAHGLVKARLLLFDAALISDVESGRRKELSVGYSTLVVNAPGVTPKGERYDSIQTKILANHIAVTRCARAGRIAQLRLDSEGRALVHDTQEPIMTTVKIRFDGQTVEVAETAAPILERADADLAAARKAKTDAEAQAAAEKTARADAEAKLAETTREKDTLAGKVAGLEKQVRSDADIQKAITEGVQARVELIEKAARVVKADAADKLTSMTPRQIMEEAVKAYDPLLKLDGKSDDFVHGIFEVAVSRSDAGTSSLANLRGASAASRRADTSADGGALKGLVDARRSFADRLAGKKALS